MVTRRHRPAFREHIQSHEFEPDPSETLDQCFAVAFDDVAVEADDHLGAVEGFA